MLSRSDRLRRAKDFALLSQKGRAVFGPFFTLRFRQNKTKTHVGFVTSTKIFKTAVARNRAKRRMREALREARPTWPENMDLLFIVKLEAMTANFQELIASVKRTFEKIPEALLQPAKPRPPKARRKTSVIYKPEK